MDRRGFLAALVAAPVAAAAVLRPERRFFPSTIFYGVEAPGIWVTQPRANGILADLKEGWTKAEMYERGEQWLVREEEP